MSEEQKSEMYAMRLSGCTYQEIADKFGCSKQYVHQSITQSRPSKSNRLANACVYRGLSEYIAKNNITICKFTGFLRPTHKGYNTTRMKELLTGERSFKMTDIRKILELTGMTFEECFALKEREDDKDE